jgi:cardiolipin synthase A/B
MPSPEGHSDWVKAIRSAKSSIHMEMYHITDRDVIDALISRADDDLDMRVIVDQKMSHGYQQAFETLTDAGVQVRPGSRAFSITHAKTLVVDGETIIISAINLTNTAQSSRDFGVITHDANVIEEVENVFDADWENAETGGDNTPPLNNENLAWSPNNSMDQLVRLIDSANSTLEAESESFTSDAVVDAFNRAADRGVRVRLIIPECVFGSNDGNYKHMAQLHGVEVHVEHDGKSIAQPYMHSKMMVADQKFSYVGSINYSYNSIERARELGIIFLDEAASAKLSSEFDKDWNRSQGPNRTPHCKR